MITLEEKKERLFMALAGGVLVITGFQCFWFLTVNGSILQAVSIVISIAIVVTLLKLDKTVAYKIEIVITVKAVRLRLMRCMQNLHRIAKHIATGKLLNIWLI